MKTSIKNNITAHKIFFNKNKIKGLYLDCRRRRYELLKRKNHTTYYYRIPISLIKCEEDLDFFYSEWIYFLYSKDADDGEYLKELEKLIIDSLPSEVFCVYVEPISIGCEILQTSIGTYQTCEPTIYKFNPPAKSKVFFL